MGIAYEFDPYFVLSMSRVDPLPHQLEAVYDYLLKLSQVRFLLAADAGAGKTIMAGLLIRELKLRGLAERIVVVCPANLTFQWQRELKEKFDEPFLVLLREVERLASVLVLPHPEREQPEVRLIEVKGIGGVTGTVCSPPTRSAWRRTAATAAGSTWSPTAAPSRGSSCQSRTGPAWTGTRQAGWTTIILTRGP